ncbi:hypothetical protein EV126DRAFT_424039 [Verticillium dahliae]|nr:hypothetical protein EV126DRAFT_424039 [Verticillium dahliae]
MWKPQLRMGALKACRHLPLLLTLTVWPWLINIGNFSRPGPSFRRLDDNASRELPHASHSHTVRGDEELLAVKSYERPPQFTGPEYPDWFSINSQWSSKLPF